MVRSCARRLFGLAPAGAETDPEARGSTGALLALIGLGTIAEVFLIYAVTQPLLLLAYPKPIAINEPLAALLGSDVQGIRGFILVVAGAFLLYVAAYAISLHCRGRQAVAIILGFSALFSVTLLLAYPAGARDIFTNIVDGRMRWLDGFNPMLQAPVVAHRDPLYHDMTYWQFEPSYYGPFWYLLLFIPTRVVGTGLVANLISFRAITIPFMLGAALVASRVAVQRDPRLEAAAALLVAWSPLLLWESAGNGHNDIVMAFFAIWALERALKGRWQAAIPLLVLSVLTKYVTLMLLPLFILVAYKQLGRRCIRPLAIGAGIATLVGVIITAPFWNGFSTFAFLADHGDRRFTSSIGTLLGVIIDGNKATAYATSPTAGSDVHLLTLLLFGLAYGVITLRLWEGRDGLLTASFYALFAYLTLISWWFWPWYVDWLVVVGGALVARRTATLAIIFSAGALFGYAILGWRNLLFNFQSFLPFSVATVAVMFVPPLVFWAAGLPRPDWLRSAFRVEPTPASTSPPAKPGFARLRSLPYNRKQSEVSRTDTGNGSHGGGQQKTGDVGASALPGGGGAD